jgi:hypothetical protein
MAKTSKSVAENMRKRKIAPKASKTKDTDWYAKAHTRLSIAKKRPVSGPKNAD